MPPLTPAGIPLAPPNGRSGCRPGPQCEPTRITAIGSWTRPPSCWTWAADLVSTSSVLGVGRTIGVDPSITMCRRARLSEASVCQATAEALPFPTGAVGGCRADRVLQHVADPAAAVAEMIRVTQTGGAVVAAEPDQESLVIAVPDVSTDLCDRVKALRRDVGYRNGRLASRLPELFGRLGLSQISVDAFPLLLTDPGDAFGLPGWPRLWRDAAARPVHGRRSCRVGPGDACSGPARWVGLCAHVPGRRWSPLLIAQGLVRSALGPSCTTSPRPGSTPWRRARRRVRASKSIPNTNRGGDGWESNPPGTAQHRPTDGFEVCGGPPTCG